MTLLAHEVDTFWTGYLFRCHDNRLSMVRIVTISTDVEYTLARWAKSENAKKTLYSIPTAAVLGRKHVAPSVAEQSATPEATAMAVVVDGEEAPVVAASS